MCKYKVFCDGIGPVFCKTYSEAERLAITHSGGREQIKRVFGSLGHGLEHLIKEVKI